MTKNEKLPGKPLIKYLLPIRTPAIFCCFELPEDLSEADVKRIYAFINTLIVPEEWKRKESNDKD